MYRIIVIRATSLVSSSGELRVSEVLKCWVCLKKKNFFNKKTLDRGEFQYTSMTTPSYHGLFSSMYTLLTLTSMDNIE